MTFFRNGIYREWFYRNWLGTNMEAFISEFLNVEMGINNGSLKKMDTNNGSLYIGIFEMKLKKNLQK